MEVDYHNKILDLVKWRMLIEEIHPLWNKFYWEIKHSLNIVSTKSTKPNWNNGHLFYTPFILYFIFLHYR